jgi:hypothetical protein
MRTDPFELLPRLTQQQGSKLKSLIGVCTFCSTDFWFLLLLLLLLLSLMMAVLLFVALG